MSGYRSFLHSWGAVKFCCIHTVLYYILAVFGFSYLTARWSIIDSLYYGTVLFTTIGYGDFVPPNPAAKLYTVCLALYGIVLLGCFMGVAGEFLMKAQTQALQAQKEIWRKKILHHILQDQWDMDLKSTGKGNEVEKKEDSLLAELLGILVKELPLLTAILCLSQAVGAAEGWPSILDGVYFAVTTGTTIGWEILHHNALSYGPPVVFCCLFTWLYRETV